MASIKCNGLPVFDATITRPAYGRWSARLRVDSDTLITGKVTISTPGMTLVGTVDPALSGIDTKVSELVVYGGAGGMTKEVPPRDYVGVTLRIVAGDLAQLVGETISPTVASSLLDTPVPRWTRLRGNAGSELKSLLDSVAPGARWRILEDGTLWFGKHEWKDAAFIHTLVELSPTSGEKTIVVEKPFLNPGVTFEGDKVYEVVDDFSEPSVRQHYNTRKTSADIEKDAATARFEPVIQPLRLYPARVAQASTLGGPLEIVPDDPRLPPMSKVPVKPGLPGFKVRVPKDARVRFEFENGDRQKPVVTSFSDAVDEVAFDNGTKPIARKDDKVNGGTLTMTAVPPLGFSLDWTGPDGVTTNVGTFAVSGTGVGSTTVPGNASLEGKIKEGVEKLKA